MGVTEDSDPTGVETGYALNAGADRARFDLVGARLTSLVLGGQELIVPDYGGGDVWWGGFLMVPWAGFLREGRFSFRGHEYEVPADWPPHALHGLVRATRFVVDGDALTAPLPEAWPFGGTVSVAARLVTNALEHTITVAAHDQPMPVTLGWHPWFRRQLDVGGPVEVHLPADAEMLERDSDRVPTGRWVTPGEPPYDDCFRTATPVTLSWPGAGRLTISTNSDYVSVFTGHDRGVVVEPQSGPSEVLAHELAAGQSLTLTTLLRWEHLR